MGKKQKEKKRLLIFQEKTLLLSLLLIVVIAAGLILAFLGCNRIAVTRSQNQMDDAVNTVVDQINTKFERDGSVLQAMAEILSKSEAFSSSEVDVAELRRMLTWLKPLQQTMNLRVLLPGNTIMLPDDEMTEADAPGFNFEEEAKHGIHISHRFESVRQGAEGTQLIAHFVPILRNGETVAMLYGATVLSRLPNEIRVGNIFNSSASVLIFDVKNTYREEGDDRDLHAVIMDTWNDSETLGAFESYEKRFSIGKQTDVRGEIMGLKKGVLEFYSKKMNEDVFFYYAPAGGVVEDQWSICVIIPEAAAFGNVKQVRGIFIAVGTTLAVAVILYFIWIRHDAKRSIRQTVERAVLEERLIKAEAAERAKTTFLSNMSHDIRTPMNAILGFTALAETNIDNKERVQDYLSKILSSGNHLLSLINDILDMSRIESGKLNIEEKPCSISDIFRDMRNIIQTQMKSKQLNFFMDTLDIVDEDIYCDKLHLNQILLNLLSNAIKFTPAGGSVSLIISQKSGAPSGYGAYEIRVKDTGIGMSREFAKHVFEPFERERNSTVSGIQGTGLGMAITKNIVDTMGGTITVDSEPGKGTEFVIELQFRLQAERKHVEVIHELEGLRALVVDDSFSTCDSVSKMLMQIGMRAEWTMHGKEAVLRAQQAVDMGDGFSAYIIDWVMPDLGGFEIVRQIRKIVGEEIPIIVITAYDVSAIMDEAEDLGVTAFCNKPIFLSELRETLVSAIEKEAPVQKDPEEEEWEKMKGKRLLLVEDNELNREIAQELLVEKGFLIETAEDGTVAVEKVKNSKPGWYDLILMDVQMPVMDGYAATKAIRALPDESLSKIPIVAMTANAFDEDRKKASECGMNAHVAKPIDLDLLCKVLKSLLSEEKDS